MLLKYHKQFEKGVLYLVWPLQPEKKLRLEAQELSDYMIHNSYSNSYEKQLWTSPGNEFEGKISREHLEISVYQVDEKWQLTKCHR